ncbi:MAG: GGDEF domain-containing protein [Xanthobacteraceae bacterium]|nr:GGDEF domain-containing protein [Xanthobacteraceae bacterium]
MDFVSPDDGVFLSTMPATRSQRRLALAVVLIATILFLVSAPFAKVQLQRIDGFIPAYETAIILFDLITAILLFGQFAFSRSRALLVLASGYLFTSTMTLAHALSFPGLFAPQGLLGAGPQTTVWLYIFWHVGFALFVIAFALLKDEARSSYAPPRSARMDIIASVCLVLVATGLLTLLATAGQGLLPPIMDGNTYGPGAYLVALGAWPVALIALAIMLQRGPRSVLDLWVMVVISVQVLEVALSATLNGGRFDLGFYLGRIYGLMAVSVVLLVLLIEHGRLYGQLVAKQKVLRRLSIADPLTAIANRRSFDEALQREWRQALTDRTTLALLLIDVDFFKPFNDGYGHLTGDHCLRLVAEVLSGGARRAGETIARYGGDEFAILLPRTDAERASALARHLCKRVGELSLPHAHSSIAPHVTISIGVASISMAHQTDQPAGEPTALIEAADRALYAAKAAGRNRVVEHAIEAAGSAERTLNANAAGWPSVLAKS